MNLRYFSLYIITVLFTVFSSIQSFAEPAFPRGGWNPGSKNEVIIISQGIPVSEGPFMFLLSSALGVDSRNLTYTLNIDGKNFIHSFSEGGSVVIEGRNLWLRAADISATLHVGTWQTVYPTNSAPRPSNTFSWYEFPNKPAFVASFLEKKLMVVSINDNTKCRNQKMTVTVDGKVLKDQGGTTHHWVPKSSVLVYGKTVSVLVSANCPAGEQVFGSLEYEN